MAQFIKCSNPHVCYGIASGLSQLHCVTHMHTMYHEVGDYPHAPGHMKGYGRGSHDRGSTVAGYPRTWRIEQSYS